MRITFLSSAVAFLLSLILLTFTSPLVEGGIGAPNEGSGTPEDPYIVPRTDSSVKVDGVLDDEAWENALVLELPYEISPGDNVPAQVRTEFLLTYNQSHLYVAFRAHDPEPSAIRAHLTDRDSDWDDDFIRVWLDTFNDERRAFIFSCNPLGVQRDEIYHLVQWDRGWDAIWDSAGQTYDWGYAVEMAIPFNQLRFQRTGGDQVWGITPERCYNRDIQRWFNSVTWDRSNDCWLCQFDKFRGFEEVSPGRNVEINPTVTAVRTDERSEMPGGDFEKRDQSAEVGLTARWGITTNLTLSATANPDFSQVEADALQLDINEPFALIYEERRPFFTEGADFFDTTLDAVYTRTMRDPSWGLKLSGKEGADTIGAYVVRDDITNLIFPSSQSSGAASLAMANTSSVFRYKRDIGRRYTLGLLATDREGDDYFNRLIGFDGDLRPSNSDRISVQLLGSSTRYPDGIAAEFGQPSGDFGDSALIIRYFHNARPHGEYSYSTSALGWWGSYTDIGRNFRADLGFIPRVGYRRYILGTGYNWIPRSGSRYSLMRVDGEYIYLQDHYGNLINSIFLLRYHYGGPMQSNLEFWLHSRREVYSSVEFDLNGFHCGASFMPAGNLTVGFEGDFGDRIDYANTRPGRRMRLAPNFTCNLGLHLRLIFNHTFERLTVEEGRLYTANISQLTASYQFNTRTFIRSILQYVDYNYNAGLYTFEIDPQYKHLFTQFLFSYKLNPRTVLFVGYSDNYFGSQQYRLTQADRTFFVKLGYAWVL